MNHVINYGAGRQQSRGVRIVNTSGQLLPAYSPLVLTYDNQQHYTPNGSPFLDGSAFGGGPRTIVDGELVWPASFACIAETGYLNCLYAVNGPVDVQPDGYGTAYLDYPRAVLIDPDSFPVPDGLGGLILGDWDDYQDYYPGDIEGPPPLGLKFLPGTNSAGQGTDQMWQPATFNFDFPLWTVLWWDVDRQTGAPVGDRAIVVPYDARASMPPAGGGANVSFDEDCQADVDNPIEGLGWPAVILKQGLYQIQSSGTLAVQAAGVGATVSLFLTFGPQWDALDLAGTPLAETFSGGAPVSGETQLLAASGLQWPQINIDDSGPYASGETVTLAYASFGFAPIYLAANIYLLPGDALSMSVATNADDPDTGDPVNVTLKGGLLYNRINNNPYSGLGIYS